MSETQDHSALKWIKAELDATLDMARHALEAYMDGAAPEAELDGCIAHLHQVRGTLQLMQLYGAAMLAEEMESAAKALRVQGERKRRESAEVLMLGMAKLPDYLEKIESGATDTPLPLLPLMNELRAVRDAALLSEVALFAPDLDQKLQAADGSQEANPELPAIARKLRFQYHKALLDWYRGQDPSCGLVRIAEIFRKLEGSAWTVQVQRLFQISRAVVQALHEGSLESGVATKLLVGKIDREIKRIMDEGEQVVAQTPANDLLKNLLYYTACADSQDPVIVNVKQLFDLTKGALSPSSLSGEQSGLQVPGRELLETLRVAISADLTAIKDQLDLFIRSKSRDLARLQAEQDPLKKLADTLGMVGQGELRSRLMRQANKIAEFVATDTDPDEQDLMAMASDILFIESSLNNLSVVRRYASLPQDDQQAIGLPAGEFERLVDSVMHEAGIDMSRNKEAIIQYIETPGNKALLQAVPRRFNGIAGAFSVLRLHDAAGLIGRLNHYVSQSLLENPEVPAPADLDALADAVTGIEYFMEAVTDGRGIHPEILVVTRDALAQLNVPETVPSKQPESPTKLPSQVVGVGVPATLETVEEPDQPLQGEASVAVHARSVDKPALEDIDPEILEIFIEEAEEELAAIQEYLPRWCENPDDPDAPVLIRRSFHTLKGSGRLVGAKVIGEFAWAIENLLNRVIDQTVETTPEITRLLNDAVTVLPDLIESQKLGTPPSVDVQPIMDRAEALVSPRPSVDEPDDRDTVAEAAGQLASADRLNALEDEIGSDEMLKFSSFDGAFEKLETLYEASPSVSSVEIANESPGSVTEASPAPIVMDETLLEIFELESRAHIETLSRFCENCNENPLACHIDKELVRALHTLHGSAEMSGVDSIAQVSTALESLTATLKGLGRHADQHALDLISRSVDLFNTTLASINVPGAELPDWQQLVAAIHAFSRTPELASSKEVTGVVIEAATTAVTPVDSDESALDIRSQMLAAVQVDTPDATPLPGEIAGSDAHRCEVDQPRSLVDDTFAERSDAVGSVRCVDESIDQNLEGLMDETLAESSGMTAAAGSAAGALVEAPAMVPLEGDPELVDIFLEEARELHESLEGTLQQCGFDIANRQISEELQRTLHTLKGGARLVGAQPVGDLSHGFESLLIAVDQARVAIGDELISLVHEVMDRLAEQIDDLSRGPSLRGADDLVNKLDQWLWLSGPRQDAEVITSVRPIEPDEPVQPIESVTERMAISVAETTISEQEGTGESATEAPAPFGLQEPGSVEDLPPLSSASMSVETDQGRSLPPSARGQREQVRVRSDLLDRLVNYAGEVSIYRSRIEQQNGQLGFNLSELEQTIRRLREQLRQLEIETEAQILFRYEQDGGRDSVHDASFDPLELDRFSAMQQVSRSLMETVNDLSNINGFLEELQVETDTLLLQQSRITTDLQDGLMRTRMVPFSQIVPRLHRVVRQTCSQLDKRAELVIQGADSEIDRGILERMIGPLEHILRNAIAHGIESSAERLATGKPQTGQIRLQLSREGTDVRLVIMDDGAGVNMAKIRAQAVKSGLLDPNAEVADSDVLPFVLEHGFSTAQEVTQISGRGVGLDVVVSEVKQLGGSLDIASRAGQGTNFIIRLPLTLAVTDALLVELGGEIYAIPHASIEGVVRISLQELGACYAGKQAAFSYAGQDYQVRYLGSLLNVGPVNLADQRKWYPLLLVRAGDHHVALQVDGLLGNRQIVVKSVGVQVATVRWIAGGTILGDGRVALILDVTALVRADVAQTTAPQHEVARVDVLAPEPGVGRTLMVVDDSITVRKVTGRLLERHGMNVITAKDGVDAVALLQEQRPDLMLLDIEMPRMDGYELARHMRNSEVLKSIPIIMITSRTGEKHRNLAMELGVRRYLGKPYQEGALLDSIYSVLEEIR